MTTATQTQRQPATQTQTKAPAKSPADLQAEQQRILEKLMRDTREVEYKPLGSDDGVRLSVAMIRNVFNPRTKNKKEASDEDIMKFIMLCKARRLNPFEGDAYLIGYDGNDGPQWSLITSIYAFLKRAEVNPNFDGMESGVIVQAPEGEIVEREGDFVFPNEKLLGGWAKVHRKDRRFPNYKRVNFATYSTGRSRWKDDPGGMICKVSECQALRDTFPTTLGGLFVREEMERTIDAPTAAPATVPLTTGRISLRRQELPQADEQPAPPEDEFAGELASETLQDEIQAEFQRIGSSDSVIKQMLAKHGAEGTAGLSMDGAKRLIGELRKIDSQREPGMEG